MGCRVRNEVVEAIAGASTDMTSEGRLLPESCFVPWQGASPTNPDSTYNPSIPKAVIAELSSEVWWS